MKKLMKLVLLHGPARVASRKKLLDLKQKFDPNNVVVFEEGSNIKDIADNLVSTSLFSDERLVILENPDENLTFDSYDSLTLVLWFDHEVGEKKPIMEMAKKEKGEIIYFPEGREISVFPFLDLLATRSPKAYLELNNLQKTHEKFSDNQYLITMILYQLRNLVTPSKTAPGFVKQKLEKQRKNFTTEELVNLYKFVLDSDYKIKSGLMDNSQAEFLIVNRFIVI